MSKALIDSLISGVMQGAAFQADSSIKGTYGEIFRERSGKAVHLLVLDKYELEYEIGDLIYRAFDYDFSEGEFDYDRQISLNPEKSDVFSKVKPLVDIIYNNLHQATMALAKMRDVTIVTDLIPYGMTYQITAPVNVFRLISTEIFAKAFGTGKNRGGITDFLKKYAADNKKLQEAIAKSKGAERAGLDIGHGYSSESDLSNIENALQVLVMNRIRTNRATKDLVLDENVDRELKELDDQLRRIANNPIAVQQLWNSLVRKGKISINKKEKGGRKYSVSETELRSFLLTFVDFGVDFIRTVHSRGEASAQLKAEVKITDIKQLEKIAEALEIAVRPQSSAFNSIMGASVQSQFGKLTGQNYTEILKVMKDWISGKKALKGMPELTPTNLSGSPSMEELIALNLYNTLKFGKSATQKASTSSRVKAKPSSITVKKAPAETAKALKGLLGGNRPVPGVKPRNLAGRFVNIINIVNIINMQLAEKIRQNMGSPGLNYRTGRFAQSAKVLTPSLDKDGAIRLPYTYMKNPYQTFEPGFARGSAARDPRPLINKSIREIAISLVTARLRIVRV